MTGTYIHDNKGIASSWSLGDFLRSDLLPHLAGLLQTVPSLRTVFPQIFQLRVVIDACVVQRELRWRLQNRKKPEARTALHEVLQCGVLVAYAPHFLETEIREHIPRLARETETSLADVHREWKEFRKHICFYTAQKGARIDVTRTDPDDVAYIDTMDEIAARAIYTRDRDFLRTTAPVILITIDTTLRRYARASSIRIGLALGSSLSVGLGLKTLLALKRLLAKLFQAARRMSPAAQALILAATAAVIAHPTSRAKLGQLWTSLSKSLKPVMREALVTALYQFVEATSTAEESYRALEEILPPSKRRPLLSHARSICLAARKPLKLDEILQGVLANGYQPRSKSPHRYLLRMLRSDERFIESEVGWIIRGQVVARERPS